jgi:hypothetical protein
MLQPHALYPFDEPARPAKAPCGRNASILNAPFVIVTHAFAGSGALRRFQKGA